MHVTKRTRELVYPASPSPLPGLVLELSNIDQILPRIYPSFLLFWKDEPLPEAAAVVLKSSLSRALTLFYPCAGRYRDRSDGGLEIVCNDAGGSFDEVWVDAELGSFLPQLDPHPDFAILVPRVDPSADISEIPLLMAQVTYFQCGRISLGIQMHHNVCDGVSFAHFVSSWSELAKSLDTSLMPHIDRSLMKARDPPRPSSDHRELQTLIPPSPASWPPCISKIFQFTPASIALLKEEAMSPGHSRFQVLAAHLWRGIVHARGLPEEQETKLGIPVDGRKRFNPPLPEGYFGNGIFCGYVRTTAGELLKNPLSFAANLVKKAVEEVGDESMRSTLDWVAKQESPKLVVPAFRTPFIDMSITSWWRFPLYELDFGWGKPDFVRTALFGRDGVIVLLPSPLGSGHVDALVGLQREQVRGLL